MSDTAMIRDTRPKHRARPFGVRYLANPDGRALRKLALERTPFIFETAYGNLNKISRVKTRMAGSTFVIGDPARASEYSMRVMDRAKAQEHLRRQATFIERAGELIQIEGYLGLAPEAYGVEWLYTPEGANIAGMQQVLAFSRDQVESPEELSRPFEPHFRLVFTPGFGVEGYPAGVLILVDLESWTTYVMGSDYFGESKKGALRMLSAWVYHEGGLVLHAGAKEIRKAGRRMTMTIKGLSGTGKTTTTFSKQGDSAFPIQDDMVCLWPEGRVSVTENGCFAKTFGLAAETEPVLHRGTTDAAGWIENGYLNEDGSIDFSKEALAPPEVARWRKVLVGTGADAARVDAYARGEVKYEEVVNEMGIPADGWDFVVWTQNGRSILPLSKVEDAADLTDLVPIRSMGILNRDEGSDAATPALVRFTSPEQASGYFMLGETSKTSAAGKERGKTRSPFTQPFFPLPHALQAERFRELADSAGGVSLWMMNTDYVGGTAHDVREDRALKVKIAHSSALLEALLSDLAIWSVDPDFGYEVIDADHPANAGLVARVPAGILQPSRFYAARGRQAEYRVWVQRMKEERRDFLQKYGVADSIVRAVTRE